jgi:hypothetical protein
VILFLADIPFWPHNARPELDALAVVIPIIPTAANRKPPKVDIRPFRWRFDSGCTSDGLIWRSDLLEAGLNPNRPLVASSALRTPSGEVLSSERRKLDLWLVSNIPALRATPFRIRTSPGVHVASVHGPMTGHFPILGMSALRRAGLKILLDYRRATASVWVPATVLQTWTHWAGRVLPHFRPVPIRWANDPIR